MSRIFYAVEYGPVGAFEQKLTVPPLPFDYMADQNLQVKLVLAISQCIRARAKITRYVTN